MKIHPSLILRTPKFSLNANLQESWAELKEAIKISSTTFYDTIKDVNAEDLENLPQKIQFTIWKYFNRAKYRATPYGTFAGFSFLNSTETPADYQIVIDSKLNLHEFIDWPIKNEIHFSHEELFEKDIELFTNSSFYLTPESIRYIACTDGQFELAEVDRNDLVIEILKSCLKPIRLNDLVSHLQDSTHQIENLNGLLSDMLSLQLLLSDHDPNIIGQDYFNRLDLKFEPTTPKYIIAERRISAGNLNLEILSALPKLIGLLQHTAPKNEKVALKNFVNRFTKKFEQKEVSLVIALDPEMGVGYDDLEHGQDNDDFVSHFKSLKSESIKINNFDFLKEKIKNDFLFEKFDTENIIFLDKLPHFSDGNKKSLPNSINLMISVADDRVCIEQLGGATANSLNGRFTIANDEVFQFTKELAEIEKNANPEVLFFDVGYMVESNVDNINRRKLIYDYQLSILNFDTSENPFVLNDIMVSVQRGEVVLRSKKYNKRLIPKIASAYNYARSDLSAFRLFCDLQHQGLQSNLLLKLDYLFPGLKSYPRLQYKNLVLSLAKWRITHKDFFDLLSKSYDVGLCREYLKKLGVSQYFKTGNSDQTLTFDTDNDLDMNCFMQYMQKQKSCYLEEVLLPDNALVIDEVGRPYNAQFILALTHGNEIYKGIQDAKEVNLKSTKRIFPPGAEWIYFEIFCHQQRSDILLITSLLNYLQAHSSEIKLWFFIRYNENGDHIRLRVLLNDERDGQKLIKSLSDHLTDELATGLVSDLMVKTYRREIERYGNDLIEDVEAHFHKDSAYVISLIQTFVSVSDKYKICAQLAIQIQREKDLFDPLVFNKMILDFSNSFNDEHGLDASTFKKLNATYQVYKKEEFPVLTDEQQNSFDVFYDSFKAILKKCNQHKRVKLFGDLMHMHVNRLFNSDQRTHEMVMYYYLLKDLQRIRAMAK